MMELKRFDVMSVAVIEGAIGVVGGLILGIVFAVASYFTVYNMPAQWPGRAMMAAGTIGPWSIIIFPIMYGVVGFIAGAVIAVVYNFVAARVGGMKVDIKDMKMKR